MALMRLPGERASGGGPLWLSLTLFVATYAVIVSEKVNRAIVSLLGASLMIMPGVLNQRTAISGIDFNTLGLLTGMMVIVAITRRSPDGITGRITLKNIVETAGILGGEMSCMEDVESKAKYLPGNPVDGSVQVPALSLGSDAPVIEALAIMEQNDTSYLFLVDDGEYRGL